MIAVSIEPEFDAFRQRCRELLAAKVPPQDVIWSERGASQLSLIASEPVTRVPVPELTVPRRFFDLARLVSCHRDPARWHLLYSVLWRLNHGEPNLLSVEIDSDVMRLSHMRQEIARDVHHMHAFVRFRRVERNATEVFIAWYRPDHRVIRLAAPFFAKRFAAMHWAILTPDESAIWDGSRLQYTNGVPLNEAPKADDLELLWSAYYGATFNPARMNVDLMRQEMPSRFWANLPELKSLPKMLSDAPARLQRMQQQQLTSARSLVPNTRDLHVLRDAAAGCTGCSLHCDATQTVFGEGPSEARIVLIGEQPGDEEDLTGRPFVGPAGEVLQQALIDAEIPREQIYVTNAVKHFRFTREGKRRIHQTPRMSEVIACKPWLEAELEAIRPEAVVLLGATAAKSLLGNTVRITRDAGKVVATQYSSHTMISVHPSFVLRSREEAQSRAVYERLVGDLVSVRRLLSEPGSMRMTF